MSEQARITVNEVVIVEVDADPAISGVDAPIGSLAILDGGAQLWQKYGVSTTAWKGVSSPSIPQTVWVNKGGNDSTGAVGDFSRPFLTVEAAYAAITDAAPSKQYVMIIGAGEFIMNNPVVAKPNVFLCGQSGSLRATKLVAGNPNAHLFSITDSVYMTNLFFGGVSGAGFALLNITGATAANGYIRFFNCSFGTTDTVMKAVGNNNFATSIIVNTCILGYGNAFTNGFLIDGLGATKAPDVILQNLIMDYIPSSPAYIGYAKNGASLRVLAGNFDGNGFPPVVGFQVESGGILELVGSRIGNCGSAIKTNNVGSAPELNATGVYLEHNTLDLNILHTTTRGNLNGISARSKITNNAPNTFVTSFNEESVGFITTGDLIVRGGYVLEPNVTITSLNGTLPLTQFSNKGQVLTGNASGFKVQLPSALLALQGKQYEIYNTTNQTVDVIDGAGTLLTTVAQNSLAFCYLQTAGSLAGTWIIWQVLLSSVASGVISYNITSSTPFTTSSTTDVPITGFNVTPQAGTYGIWYNSDDVATQNNAVATQTIYKNGIAITDSVRRTQSVSSNFIFQQTSMTIAKFNGQEACDVRVRTSQGSLTVNGRSLLLIRLGT